MNKVLQIPDFTLDLDGRVDRPKDLSGALQAVHNIFNAWDLSIDERLKLLAIPKTTYYRWSRAATLEDIPPDTLERMSYVLGIWKALHILYAEPHAANEWLRRPNSDPTFAGNTPLESMKHGQVADLYRVRHFLDGWRG